MNKTEIYQKALWPLLEKTDPNLAHDKMVDLIEWLQNYPALLNIMERVLTVTQTNETNKLAVQIAGMEFENPIWLAAGMDKDGRIVESMYRLGFSSVVVGTVLDKPQAGNPLPTIFRLENGVLLNRMGFPSQGMVAVKNNLAKYQNRNFPLGISVGMNRWVEHTQAPQAHAKVVSYLNDSADYFVLNTASPNTPGLRQLQQHQHLTDIAQVVSEATDKPILVKVSPDLSQQGLDDVIRVVIDNHLAGIVATNTTKQNETGGVSGWPLREKSTQIVKHIYKETNDQIDIVGSGGVEDLNSTLEKIQAGAKGVALLTGLVYKGPSLPSTLNAELLNWMATQGVNNLEEIRGQNAYSSP